ncbi:MAG: OmpW family outer membrane protein [Ignavibacteria bacterium]
MRNKLLIIPALFIIFNISISSQTKYSLSFFGGYSMPLADLKGDFPDTVGTTLLNFNKSSTLLTKSGFNFGVIGKMCIDTLGKAKVTGGFTYNSFTGSKDYPRTGALLTYKNKVNIFTISAGAQYSFFPKKKFDPFVGLDLAANFFSGEITANGDSSFTIKRKSEARFGIIANAGLDIKLNKSIGAVIGVKYSLTNLIGKKTDIITTSTTITDIEQTGSSSLNELGLNDEESSNNTSKTLYYLQIYAGITFYFGELIK